MLDLGYRLRPNFTVRELCCPCGCGYGRELSHYEDAMLDGAQAVRDEVGYALGVTSALRCEKYNEEVGGVDLSAHTRALAIDFGSAGTFSRRRLLDAAVKLEVPGIGLARGFVHCDWDLTGIVPRPGCWPY